MSCGSLVVVLLIFAVVIAIQAAQKGGAVAQRNTDGGWGTIDIVQVQLALDARSRRFVQEKLMELARGDTQSKQGLAHLARETALLLRRAEAAWIYAGVREWNPQSPDAPRAEAHESPARARTDRPARGTAARSVRRSPNAHAPRRARAPPARAVRRAARSRSPPAGRRRTSRCGCLRRAGAGSRGCGGSARAASTTHGRAARSPRARHARASSRRGSARTHVARPRQVPDGAARAPVDAQASCDARPG